jgi:hypothetical protein
MATPLSALSSLLSSGIATIEATYAKHGATFPSIDEPFRPGPLDGDESLCETIDLVIAAASQLIALVKPPPRTIVECGSLVSGYVCRWPCRWIDIERISFTFRRAFRWL